MQNADEILTAVDVARILKVSRATVYRLRGEGSLLPRFKLFESERGWRWTRGDVDAFLLRCTIARIPDESPRRFVPVKLADHASVHR